MSKDSLEINSKIYKGLLKRDAKEKNIVVGDLIEANDSLVKVVSLLRNEKDDLQQRLDHLQTKCDIQNRRLTELEILLKEKDGMIKKFMTMKK